MPEDTNQPTGDKNATKKKHTLIEDIMAWFEENVPDEEQ